MAWVSGGALGIGLPLRGDVGFGIASGALLVLSAMVVQGVLQNRRVRRLGRRRPEPPRRPDAAPPPTQFPPAD
jgi:hypothetical protein